MNTVPYSASTRIAMRMNNIAPFHVMEIQERASQLEAQGRRIVHMEIGQPDFGAPTQVIEAALSALKSRSLGYTGALGIPELREAIAKHYHDQLGASVPVESIAVTPGASGAFLLLLGALINPADEVLMPDPCYPCNRHFVRLFDGVPVLMPVGAESNFQPTLAQIQAAWGPRTRGVILASPSNPAGTVVSPQEMQAIATWLSSQGGFLIVDEIYQGLVYDISSVTALKMTADNVFVVNSFSKYFCMTGWRLGWLVSPPAFMRSIEKLAQNMFICPSAPAQYAALGAFTADSIAVLEARRREFQARRNFMLPAIRKLGFAVTSATSGAFYIYANCSSFGLDGSEISRRALEEAGVAITPGLDFGSNGAEQHVRFAYTRPTDQLAEGIERLGILLRGK